MNKTIAISGSTGLIGTLLVEELSKNEYNVIALSRNPSKFSNEAFRKVIQKKYDPYDPDSMKEIIEEANVFIHLAGASLIGKRWTNKQKKILYDSRILTTKKIVEAIKIAERKPELFICGAGVGFYGTGEYEVNEDSPPGDDFLSKLVDDWEIAASEVEKFGVRRISLRMGIVLSKRGGALPKLVLPFKFFLGGFVGSGKQFVPWIHEKDLADIVNYIIENRNITGAINCCSPYIVNMKEFCETIGKVINRKCWTRVPEFILKVVLGQASVTVTKGQKAIPKKILDHGFKFQFENIEHALRNLQ